MRISCCSIGCASRISAVACIRRSRGFERRPLRRLSGIPVHRALCSCVRATTRPAGRAAEMHLRRGGATRVRPGGS